GHILLTGFFSWRPAAARAQVRRAARAAIERCFMSRSFLGSPSNTPHPRSAFLVSWNGMCDTPSAFARRRRGEGGRHAGAPIQGCAKAGAPGAASYGVILETVGN